MLTDSIVFTIGKTALSGIRTAPFLCPVASVVVAGIVRVAVQVALSIWIVAFDIREVEQHLTVSSAILPDPFVIGVKRTLGSSTIEVARHVDKRDRRKIALQSVHASQVVVVDDALFDPAELATPGPHDHVHRGIRRQVIARCSFPAREIGLTEVHVVAWWFGICLHGVITVIEQTRSSAFRITVCASRIQSGDNIHTGGQLAAVRGVLIGNRKAALSFFNPRSGYLVQVSAGMIDGYSGGRSGTSCWCV